MGQGAGRWRLWQQVLQQERRLSATHVSVHVPCLCVHPSSQRGCYAYVVPDANPAASVSLRAIDPDRFTIVDESSQEVLEEIEESKAFFEVYDGAIYMYQGRTYLCKRLDVGARVAVVRPVQVKYYTAPIDVVGEGQC